MQPLIIPPAYLADLAPLQKNWKRRAFDVICLNGSDHDILAVQGNSVFPPDTGGLSLVTWKGCERGVGCKYNLRSGWLVLESDSEPDSNWNKIPFTGAVIVGARPQVDDISPGYLVHELGYSRVCMELTFQDGKLKSKERCDALRVYEIRLRNDDDDDEWMANLLTVALTKDWMDSCDCPLDAVTGCLEAFDLDRILSILVRIEATVHNEIHPYKLLAQLMRRLREGEADPSAPRNWTRWHQKLHELFGKCGSLRMLESQLKSHMNLVFAEVQK